MSRGRLQGFVSRSDRQGRSRSPFAPDRAAALALKFPNKQTTTPAVAQDIGNPAIDQGFSSIARNSEHEESQIHVTFEKNTYQSLGLDSTVSSDFDHTRSDSPAQHDDNADLNAPIGKDDQILKNMNSANKINEGHLHAADAPSYDPHISERYPASQDILTHALTRPTRFLPLETRNHNPKMGPLRSTDFCEEYNKRNHLELSEKGFLSTDQADMGDDNNGDEDHDNHGDNDDLSYETTIDSNHSLSKNLRTDTNLYDSRLENMPYYAIGDYDDETLEGMTYAELDAQSWEDEPGKKAFIYPRELKAPGISLETKINYYLAITHKDKNVTGPVRKTAEAFYGQLSSQEWDQAGEIFINKFTDLMQKLQEKRREKRLLAEKFESSIREREKFVRGRSRALEKKLQDMRTNGESLLMGKSKV